MMNIDMKRLVTRIVIAMSLLIGIWGSISVTDACNVMVVSSYHEFFPYNLEVNEGIEEVLGTECTLTYVYLDVLTDPQGVETKAQEAFRQYQAMQPDGVIALGDSAQEAFVVPYLREKVKTPVMFCGVFFPEIYSYPASNVSGIKVRAPIEDVIVFVQQLVPEIAVISFLFGNEPSTHAVIEQISREKDSYPVTVLTPVVVTTSQEAVEQAAALKDQCDALYIGPISSSVNIASGPFSSEKLLFSAIREVFGKATFTNLAYHVEAGLLCGVKEFPQEQGQVTAEMLQKAMSGTPVADLPITQNQFGQRILNKTVLKELGITPSRQVLTGVEIVETIQ
ncbi:MAG: ABC transporter substrate binding protein [Candidatus Vecturithrix sp.]|jgi:ABC-type uncharacterized transport system substrate-binding protein|nr:ABC transporter substrate binding protein [Candidatus Vecturithrix sp.]